MTLGPTHYRFAAKLDAFNRYLTMSVGGFKANTYVDHPWPGWDRYSVDYWGLGGRGDPISDDIARRILRRIWHDRFELPVRHYIYRHDLWTSFGGLSVWASNDHSGRLRHVHLTVWP